MFSGIICFGYLTVTQWFLPQMKGEFGMFKFTFWFSKIGVIDVTCRICVQYLNNCAFDYLSRWKKSDYFGSSFIFPSLLMCFF